MQKQRWPEAKRKLKKAIEQGLEVLKESGEEAQQIANQTTRLLRLEFDIHQLKNRIEKATYQLGKSLAQSSQNGELQITPQIQKLHAQLTSWKETLQKMQTQVRRINIIHKH